MSRRHGPVAQYDGGKVNFMVRAHTREVIEAEARRRNVAAGVVWREAAEAYEATLKILADLRGE